MPEEVDKWVARPYIRVYPATKGMGGCLARVNPDVVGRRLDDRFVVVNLRTNRIYELNRTASVLWELLDEGVSDAELETQVREHFDVDPSEVRREIQGTLRVLTDAGLVSTP